MTSLKHLNLPQIDHDATIRRHDMMLRIASYAQGLIDSGKSGHLMALVDDHNRAASNESVSVMKSVSALEETLTDHVARLETAELDFARIAEDLRIAESKNDEMLDLLLLIEILFEPERVKGFKSRTVKAKNKAIEKVKAFIGKNATVDRRQKVLDNNK